MCLMFLTDIKKNSHLPHCLIKGKVFLLSKVKFISIILLRSVPSCYCIRYLYFERVSYTNDNFTGSK